MWKGSSIKYVRSYFVILDLPPYPVRAHTFLVYTPFPSPPPGTSLQALFFKRDMKNIFYVLLINQRTTNNVTK